MRSDLEGDRGPLLAIIFKITDSQYTLYKWGLPLDITVVFFVFSLSITSWSGLPHRWIGKYTKAFYSRPWLCQNAHQLLSNFPETNACRCCGILISAISHLFIQPLLLEDKRNQRSWSYKVPVWRNEDWSSVEICFKVRIFKSEVYLWMVGATVGKRNKK